ncbi:MAG: DUF3127 domain-containing protein [Chitinophagales bacterium]|nr:DUF3127 domain-containing protein [Chitinophagales bacterium]
MEISGTIIQILPLQEGEGRNGPWKKQDFILETKDQYPKKVCISIWGDKIDQFNLSEGKDITASINVESREYNGRWYTDVKAWKIEEGEGSHKSESGNSAFMVPPPAASDVPQESGDVEDDLPF